MTLFTSAFPVSALVPEAIVVMPDKRPSPNSPRPPPSRTLGRPAAQPRCAAPWTPQGLASPVRVHITHEIRAAAARVLNLHQMTPAMPTGVSVTAICIRACLPPAIEARMALCPDVAFELLRIDPLNTERAKTPEPNAAFAFPRIDPSNPEPGAKSRPSVTFEPRRIDPMSPEPATPSGQNAAFAFPRINPLNPEPGAKSPTEVFFEPRRIAPMNREPATPPGPNTAFAFPRSNPLNPEQVAVPLLTRSQPTKVEAPCSMTLAATWPPATPGAPHASHRAPSGYPRSGTDPEHCPTGWRTGRSAATDPRALRGASCRRAHHAQAGPGRAASRATRPPHCSGTDAPHRSIAAPTLLCAPHPPKWKPHPSDLPWRMSAWRASR
jgi:hypothetical protein